MWWWVIIGWSFNRVKYRRWRGMYYKIKDWEGLDYIYLNLKIVNCEWKILRRVIKCWKRIEVVGIDK